MSATRRWLFVVVLASWSTSGCFIEPGLRGGAAWPNERAVFAGGAQLTTGVAWGPVRVGPSLGARAAGEDGARWLLGLSGGGVIGGRSERPGFHGVELTGLFAVPLEQGQLMPRAEFQLGVRATTQWWFWRRRAPVDRGRSLWVVNILPVFFFGLDVRVNFDRDRARDVYAPVPDLALVVGLQYRVGSDFLDP